MKKCILLFGILLCTSVSFAITPTPRKILPALNKGLFKTPLPHGIIRQSFSKLQVSQQLEALSQAERTLLLTHKFIEENNRWPRTVITQEGQLVTRENYTQAQQQEVALGMLLRSTLEKSPKTDPLIRQELENLKNRFSTHRTHQFMLDQLNEWFATHDTWPRNEIFSTTPLTLQEKAEIELANYANKITEERKTYLPKELIEQIQFIRAVYDPTYILPSQTKQEEFYHLLEDTYNWLYEHHTWPAYLANRIDNALKLDINQSPALIELSSLKNTHLSLTRLTCISSENAAALPSRAATEYSPVEQEVLSHTDYTPDTRFIVSSEYAKNVRQELIKWLQTHHFWPYVITDKPLTQYTLLDMKGELLAKAILRLRKVGVEVNDIRTAWIKGDLDLDEQLTQILENEVRLKNNNEYLLYVETPPELNPRPRPDLEQVALFHSPIRMLQDLENWLEEYQAWPSVVLASGKLTAEQRDYALDLLTRIEAFAILAHPNKGNTWRTVTSKTQEEVLSRDEPYQNPYLEKLRSLYQKWN